MDQWQRRIERAEALGRRFPFSAELMWFYRDIVRFQAEMPGVDVSPLLGLGGELGAFFRRVMEGESGAEDCGHAGRRVHVDAEFPHIGVEACDVCGLYRKVMDLEQDPGAIFEVDDLASVPLDLWAVANGYRKLRVNLFGL
jgi:formate dehydrogenase maturation protein FdhE